MKRLYILHDPTSIVKEGFIRNKIWSKDEITSIIVRKKKNGEFIQVFCYGKLGEYNHLNEQTVELISDETLRFIDYGKIIAFTNETMKNVEKYILR